MTPTYDEIEVKRDSGATLSALEQFVLDNEPAGIESEKKFREGLTAVVAESKQEVYDIITGELEQSDVYSPKILLSSLKTVVEQWDKSQV